MLSTPLGEYRCCLRHWVTIDVDYAIGEVSMLSTPLGKYPCCLRHWVCSMSSTEISDFDSGQAMIKTKTNKGQSILICLVLLAPASSLHYAYFLTLDIN